MMPNDLREKKFDPQGIDARNWVKEFNRLEVSRGQQPTDPELMLGWFANAIMAGYDAARRKYEVKRPTEICDTAHSLENHIEFATRMLPKELEIVMKKYGYIKQPTELYVVTQGTYSDYHIEAIYDNEKDAEYCASMISGQYDSAQVEKWKLNTGKPKIYTWFCRISRKGEIVSCEKWDARLENSRGIDIHGNFYAMGETEEETKKNAIDFRTQKLAEVL